MFYKKEKRRINIEEWVDYTRINKSRTDAEREDCIGSVDFMNIE